MAKKIAEALLLAKNPLIVSGTGCGSEAILMAAANISKALNSQQKKSSLCFVFPEANSMGLGMMAGKSLDELLTLSKQSSPDILVVLENDLYRRAGRESIDTLIQI